MEVRTMLRDNVLLDPEGFKFKTKGGILLPPGEQRETFRATVLKTGPEVNELKKGDKVVYGNYKREKVMSNDKVYIMMREADILGILVEND